MTILKMLISKIKQGKYFKPASMKTKVNLVKMADHCTLC